MSVPVGYIAKKLSEGFAVAPIETTIITAVGLVAYGIYEAVKK